MKPNCCIDKGAIKEIGQTAGLLKIIADENRLKILCALKKRERCVCDIWQDLNIPQNLASHHLKVLKDSGLIDSRKEGLWVIYKVNSKALTALDLLISNLLRS